MVIKPSCWWLRRSKSRGRSRFGSSGTPFGSLLGRYWKLLGGSWELQSRSWMLLESSWTCQSHLESILHWFWRPKCMPKSIPKEEKMKMKFKRDSKVGSISNSWFWTTLRWKLQIFAVCGDVKTVLRTLKKLIHGNFPLRSPSQNHFDGEEWPGQKR